MLALLIARSQPRDTSTDATPSKRKAGEMVKVAAYHTSVPEYGGERNVYHDQSECPAGKRIKPEHRTPGTAGRPKCKDCQNIG